MISGTSRLPSNVPIHRAAVGVHRCGCGTWGPAPHLHYFDLISGRARERTSGRPPVDLDRAPAAQPHPRHRRRSRCAGGAGAALLLPPAVLEQRARCCFPSATEGGSGKTGGYDADTQIRIATSAEILKRAGQQMKPKLSPAGGRRPRRRRGPHRLDRGDHGERPDERPGRGSRRRRRRLARRLPEDTSQGRQQLRAEGLPDSASTRSRRALDSVNAEIKKAEKRIADKGRTSEAGRFDAAALSDLTAVRAQTVLDIDALKKQLAGEGVTSGQVAAGAERHRPRQPGRASDLRRRCR